MQKGRRTRNRSGKVTGMQIASTGWRWRGGERRGERGATIQQLIWKVTSGMAEIQGCSWKHFQEKKEQVEKKDLFWNVESNMLILYEPAPQTLITNMYSWFTPAPPLALQPAYPVVCTLGHWAEAMLRSWTRGWQSNVLHFGNDERKKQISAKSDVTDKKLMFQSGKN